MLNFKNIFNKESFMKLLTTKGLLLSSALLLGSFNAVFAKDAAAAAAPQNAAEVKYDGLLKAGDYDALGKFLDQMVARMKTQYEKAIANEAELKADEFADEAEIENAHRDTVGKQFAVRFWEERQAAVVLLKTSAEKDAAQVQKVAEVLPKVRQMISDAISAQHGSNAQMAELQKYLDENADFIASVPELNGKKPKITFEKAISQVMQENKLNGFADAVEAYLRKVEQEAADHKATGERAAISVERSSNSKEAGKAKKKPKKDAADVTAVN